MPDDRHADRRQPAQDLPQATPTRCRCCAASTWRSTSGEFLSVVGASGSGKSTLLHLLGTLDRPDDGAIHLDGRRIDNLPGRERDRLRNQTFGFIFQFYHLLPELDDARERADAGR